MSDLGQEQGIPEVEEGSAAGCKDALVHLRQRLAEGAHWYPALLEAIALWRLPEETIDDRHYRYLIGGEAFDWLLLAERLTDSLDGAIPEDEREALLFFGQAPLEMGDDEFKGAIGGAKHRAHLNFLYGVTVEEALQLAVEEDVHKERRAHVGDGHTWVDEEVCRRIYGKGRMELLTRFREQFSLPPSDSIAYSDLKAFTYWLFKYRVNNCDRARVASDTRRALIQLSKMEDVRRRRSKRRPA
jgi:hypothetical protein